MVHENDLREMFETLTVDEIFERTVWLVRAFRKTRDWLELGESRTAVIADIERFSLLRE